VNEEFVARATDAASAEQSKGKRKKPKKDLLVDDFPYRSRFASSVIGLIGVILVAYVYHCTLMASEAYSHPGIILSAHSRDGKLIIFDDYRETYDWLAKKTAPDAKIMAWWDYGYQLNALANRTTYVDNNTWNNTHIARVGQAFASSEEDAMKILRELDVDYVMVVFGGMIGYPSDDMNKFLWMVRIGGSTPQGAHIKEMDYYDEHLQFRVDDKGAPKLLDSLAYKLSYYRFNEQFTGMGQSLGYDRVRRMPITSKEIKLTHLEEAHTSPHWIVRIYRVLKDAEGKSMGLQENPICRQ